MKYWRTLKIKCSTEGLIGGNKYSSKILCFYNKERFKKKIAKKYKKNKFSSTRNLSSQYLILNFLKIHNSIIASSVVVEKELLDFIGGFRPIPSSHDYAPDYDCWLGLLRLTNCEIKGHSPSLL